MSMDGRQIFALGNCSLHCSIKYIHVGRIARWQGRDRMSLIRTMHGAIVECQGAYMFRCTVCNKCRACL